MGVRPSSVWLECYSFSSLCRRHLQLLHQITMVKELQYLYFFFSVSIAICKNFIRHHEMVLRRFSGHWFSRRIVRSALILLGNMISELFKMIGVETFGHCVPIHYICVQCENLSSNYKLYQASVSSSQCIYLALNPPKILIGLLSILGWIEWVMLNG